MAKKNEKIKVKIINQGFVVLDGSSMYVIQAGENVIAAHLPLFTTDVIAHRFEQKDGVDGLELFATKSSTRKKEVIKSTLSSTLIAFDELKDWYVFSYSIYKHYINICFIRDSKK